MSRTQTEETVGTSTVVENKLHKLNDAEKAQLQKNINTIRMVAGGVGTLAGAGYAFYKKKGFWGYVGFILLGGIVAGAIGTIATAPMVSKLEANQ